MVDIEELKTAMGDLEEDAVLKVLKEVMSDGGTRAQEAMEACQKGMDIVGSRFESGEYYISDLMFAGELMMESVTLLSPALIHATGESLGKMVICTVEGDLHDIGKNIVKAIMIAAGFEVIDLGIDVPPAAIVEAAKTQGAKVIAMSGVLTIAVNGMKETVDGLKEAGIRDDVHVIIGGASVSESVCETVGADAWSINPQAAVGICRQWAQE
ncbi:MAG: cobalamin-dependent protein [Eggerthellaceae bacterium]|nr:cobalamin-dependent protein [Eggerthellaceae bacterium]